MSPLLPLLLVSPVRWTCLTFIKITRLKMEHYQTNRAEQWTILLLVYYYKLSVAYNGISYPLLSRHEIVQSRIT